MLEFPAGIKRAAERFQCRALISSVDAQNLISKISAPPAVYVRSSRLL